MMICPESFVSEYKDASFEELIVARENLIEEIKALERIVFDKDKKDDAWNTLPGPDVRYQVNLEYLSALSSFIKDKYNSEIVWR